jgi:flagellar biosynthesis/type III secretory pathway M-ring protein FliF/YscJ
MALTFIGFSPLVFLGLSVLWVLVVLGFIWRAVARLNREAKAEDEAQAQMERRMGWRKS